MLIYDVDFFLHEHNREIKNLVNTFELHISEIYYLYSIFSHFP